MIQNLSAINASGLVPLTQGVNEVLMGNSYGVLLLIAIAAIVFISFIQSSKDMNLSLGYTSIICGILAFFLRNNKLLTEIQLLTVWIIVAIVAMLSVLTQER